MTSLHLQRAEGLIDECEIREPPVNIYQLILACERELHFARLSSGHQGTCLSLGQFIPSTVILNSYFDNQWRRRRFTAAHELNHALFHDGYDAETSSYEEIDRLERESNSFAALILMPQSLLISLENSYGFLSIKMISEIFGVSSEAARYRLYAYKKLAFRDVISRENIDKNEKRLYQDFQYMEVPEAVKHWKILNSIIHGPQMMPYCLRCGCLKLDEYPEVCWGCGKNTTLYIGEAPLPLVGTTQEDIEEMNNFAVQLLR